MSKNKMHDLRVWPEYYQEIVKGNKTFEAREIRDRDFKNGDVLWLREWDPKTELYSGYNCYMKVTYILYGGAFGVEEGYCIMGINPIKNN